jgi:hypothetical protein
MYDDGKYKEGVPAYIEQYGENETNSWPVAFEDKKSKQPFWVRNWNYWAKKTGNPRWRAWGMRIKNPWSVKLGKEWIEMTGGIDCSKIVARSKVAPKIRPGVVITPDNAREYPGLGKLWPQSMIDRLTKGAYMPIKQVAIAPTQHYYLSRGVLKNTREYSKQVRLDAQGMLKLGDDNYVGGIPFPVIPKWGEYDKMTNWKIVHNMDRLVIGQDQLTFKPMVLPQYDKNGNLERTVKMGLFWRIYWGRNDLDPRPFIPDKKDQESKGSISCTYPFDKRGFAATRWRYTDLDKADLFMCYLPDLRRTRRLSGADTQDPILGTELTWEDWKVWWQKISQDIWPSECRALREEEFLAPTKWDTDFKIDADGCIDVSYERRPSWVIDYIAAPQSGYFYKIRRVWLDFEKKRCNYDECYDQRGRLWRTWLDINRWIPESGYWTWWGCDITDHVNKHRTILHMTSIANDPTLTDEYFDLRFLSRMAH